MKVQRHKFNLLVLKTIVKCWMEKMISNQSRTHCSIFSIHLCLTDVIDLFHKGQSINNSFVFMKIDIIDFSHKWHVKLSYPHTFKEH